MSLSFLCLSLISFPCKAPESSSSVLPHGFAPLQSVAVVITSCLNRQMELERVTGNFLSPCFSVCVCQSGERGRGNYLTGNVRAESDLDKLISSHGGSDTRSLSLSSVLGSVPYPQDFSRGKFKNRDDLWMSG